MQILHQIIEAKKTHPHTPQKITLPFQITGAHLCKSYVVRPRDIGCQKFLPKGIRMLLINQWANSNALWFKLKKENGCNFCLRIASYQLSKWPFYGISKRIAADRSAGCDLQRRGQLQSANSTARCCFTPILMSLLIEASLLNIKTRHFKIAAVFLTHLLDLVSYFTLAVVLPRLLLSLAPE